LGTDILGNYGIERAWLPCGPGCPITVDPVLSPAPATARMPQGRILAGNLLAGAVCSVVMVAYAGSCSGLVFSGSLSGFGGQGMLAALVGTVVTVLVLSRWSSFEFSLGGTDSNPSAILAGATAAIAAKIVGESGPASEALLPTLLVWISTSALGCGLILVLIGERKLGRCVRFVPHPVIGGFLGGTGYLLVVGSFKMMTGAALGADALARVGGVPPLAWVTVLTTGLLLTVLLRSSRHALAIPAVLIGATCLFYGWLLASGRSVGDARKMGLLMDPLQLGGWVNAFHFPYALVRWDLVLLHWNDFAVMTVVVIITCLLNATSLDVATGRDVDIDRELRALGIANVLGGLAGGMVTVNSFNRSVLNQKAGASSPSAARFSAALVVLLMLAAPGLTGLIPRPVLTGLVLYLGLTLLVAWLWDARRTMPTGDYLIIAAIVVIVAVWGIVPGVLLGLVIACLNFVFAFSKTPAVKYAFTAANQRSNVERTPVELRSLADFDGALRGFVLQGYLFFGTASTVLEEIRKVLGDARFVVLDLWLVRGLDSSSAIALTKIRNLAAERKVSIVITGASAGLLEQLRRANFKIDDPMIKLFPDLDHGLEWCENALLAHLDLTLGPFSSVGGPMARFEAEGLQGYLESKSFSAGETIIRQGDLSESMYIIGRGQVSVYLRTGSGPGGSAFTRRLRTFGVGTVVGEMGLYSGERRSADVVADVDSVLLLLTRSRLNALEREDPACAQRFHRYVIATLALRLHATNEQVRLLL
jgi:sulfate permease, SulP family